MHTSTFIWILLCGFVNADDLIRLPMKRMLLPSRAIATRDGKTVILTNVGNVAYSTVIKVGIHKRPFIVQVDTGSADLFIPSVQCAKCGQHHRFHCPRPGNRYLELQYGLGYAAGPVCRDQVTIGGLTVHNQNFVVANKIDEFLLNYPFDGIMGMAFRDASLSYYNPVIFNMFLQHKLLHKVFSFYLTSKEEGQSELQIGGSNPEHYEGNLTYVPVHSYDGQWEVALDEFQIGDEVVTDNTILESRVILDTGNTDISVPGEPKIYFNLIFAEIKRAIPTVKVGNATYFGGYQGHTLHVPEEEVYNLPELLIRIAGQTFILGPDDYKGEPSLEYELHRQLYLTTIPTSQWLFGDIFLRKVYTQFDIGNMRVGFAKVRDSYYK